VTRPNRIVVPVRIAGALLVAAQIAAFAVASRGERRLLASRRSIQAISPGQVRGVGVIRSRIPVVEPLLYVTNKRGSWLPRLWERALCPQPVAILTAGPKLADRVADLRQSLGIRWALAAGSPPPDPGFAWHVRLPPLPGPPQEFWFGELESHGRPRR
jgi:hypothetical protein